MRTAMTTTLLVLILSSCLLAEDRENGQPLFNGQDLSNWNWVSDDESSKKEQVWTIKEGVLHCTGTPRGYLRTHGDNYHDYVLTVEWRWPENSPGGNNGVLVHTSTPAELGVWPKSIEVQLAHGQAGDFWVIGTDLDVPDEASRKKDRRHLNLTDDSEKPIGQWNQMRITCHADKITVKVNGDLVNEATNCSVTEGAICLQSEGAPIEFRRVELQKILSE